MWNEYISCHINKQEMSRSLVISGVQMWMRLPKLWSSRCCHHLGIAEELGQCKKQGEHGNRIGRRELSCRRKGWMQCARGLHLPIHRMRNPLTSYLIFSVQTPCSLCCKLVYSLTSPSSSLEQCSQSYWEAGSKARSPKHSHQIK